MVECVKENNYGFQVGKQYYADDYPTLVLNLVEVQGVHNGEAVTYFSKSEKSEFNTIFKVVK